MKSFVVDVCFQRLVYVSCHHVSHQTSYYSIMTVSPRTSRPLRPGVWAPIPTFFDANEELGELIAMRLVAMTGDADSLA